MATEQLLRQYVRSVLREDDSGGVYSSLASADAMQNPYGVSFGSGEELYNIFVRPFTDVVQTAAGKTKELSQRTLTLLHVAFEAVATSIIPILRDDYAQIFAKEKDSLDKIKREYSDVLQRTWDAFMDHDVLLAAFLYSPASFITAGMVKKSPTAVAGILSVLSGGELDNWLAKVGKAFDFSTGAQSQANKDVGGKGGFGYYEGLVREDGKQLPPVEKVLANDKVIARVSDSEVTKKLERVGKELVQGTLKGIYKQAHAVSSAKSLEDLQKKLGKPLKGMDKLKKVPQAEREKAEQPILAGAKKSMLAFYVKNLQGLAKQAVDAGVPQDSPYVQDIVRVASKIKAL